MELGCVGNQLSGCRTEPRMGRKEGGHTFQGHSIYAFVQLTNVRDIAGFPSQQPLY